MFLYCSPQMRYCVLLPSKVGFTVVWDAVICISPRLGAESHGRRAKLLDEGREFKGQVVVLCLCQGWCQNSQADYWNDLPIFHRVPYPRKKTQWSTALEDFHTINDWIAAVAGGKEAIGLDGCMSTRQFTRWWNIWLSLDKFFSPYSSVANSLSSQKEGFIAELHFAPPLAVIAPSLS